MKIKLFVNSRSINNERAIHSTYGPFETYEAAEKWMVKYAKSFALKYEIADWEETNDDNFGHEIHI